jgi:hypothetical protein
MNFDARKVQRGQSGGEERGANEGKGPVGTLGFLTRFRAKGDFRPLKIKSRFDVES